MSEDPQEAQPLDASFDTMLNNAQAGVKVHRVRLWYPKLGRKWFSKLLIILLYIGFTLTPAGCNISPSACLWFDAVVRSKPHVVSMSTN